MKKFYVSTAFLLYFSFGLYAQSQIIFDKQNVLTFLIRYDQGQSNIKNQIFRKIAQGYSKPIANVSLTFSFKQHRQILKRSNRLEFIVGMSDIRITGDKMYREFDIGETLIPKKISFTLQWVKNNQVINSYTFNDINVNNSNVELVHMTVIDTINAENYKIKLINKVFDYTIQNKQEFDAKAVMIDKYYDENRTARNRLRRLNNINANRDYLSHLENLNELYRFRDTANSAEVYVNTVKQKDFYRFLPLDTYDPAGLKNKLNRILNKAQTLRDVCTDLINHFDRIYYERGIEMLARHNPGQADFYFNKSIEINPGFTPSHFQLARLYYNSGYIDKAVDKLFQIRGMNPDTETKMQTVELARGIYNDFLLNAGEMNNNGRYDDAVATLTRAAQICRDFPEVRCRQAMDVEMSRAINGKYHQILNTADINFRNNNLAEAEKVISDAMNFANQNRDFITDKTEISKRISTLYRRYIERGDKFTYNKKYTQAINAYDNAARVCNGYQQINCSDALTRGYNKARSGIYYSYLADAEKSFRTGNNEDAETFADRAISYRKKYNLRQSTKEDRLFLDIKQAIYNNLISEAKDLSASGRYRDALNKYDKATNIQSGFSIRKDLKLAAYINETAEKSVIEIINNGKNKVKVNDLQKARELYNKSKIIAEKYAVEDNPKVNIATTELKKLIFKRECINAQNAYDNIVSNAYDLINSKKYIAADKKFDEALNLAKKYEKCEIDTKKAATKKDYIYPAVKYLKDIESVQNYLQRKNYKSAVGTYISAERYYEVQKIKNYGINHILLFDFIQKSYSDFIIYCVGFYTHNKDYDKALDLLRELSRRKTKRSYTKEMQTVLATETATRDFGIDPKGNYKTYIAKYTGGNKFFKYFKKAYKKQWKNLD